MLPGKLLEGVFQAQCLKFTPSKLELILKHKKQPNKHSIRTLFEILDFSSTFEYQALQGIAEFTCFNFFF